jgi:hypothetical protein
VKINIKANPVNRTKFNKGDNLKYKGDSPTVMLVTGEDDMYLHTFVIGTGDYWGVLKVHPNLSCLEVI